MENNQNQRAVYVVPEIIPIKLDNAISLQLTLTGSNEGLSKVPEYFKNEPYKNVDR